MAGDLVVGKKRGRLVKTTPWVEIVRKALPLAAKENHPSTEISKEEVPPVGEVDEDSRPRFTDARPLFFKDSFHNDNHFQTLRPVQFVAAILNSAANPTAAGLPARATPRSPHEPARLRQSVCPQRRSAKRRTSHLASW